MDAISNNIFGLERLDGLDTIDDQEDAVMTIPTSMFPSDGKADYRTRNSETNPFQRTTGTDRRGLFEIRCQIRDVIHGTMSPDNPSSFATLIVFRCAFFSRNASRRAKTADVELVFKGLGASAPNPVVEAMVPQGKYCLMPEIQDQTVTREAMAGVTLPVVAGAGAEGALKWQKTGTGQKKKYTTIIGEPGLVGDEGDYNSAVWWLQENLISHEGVPEAFQGAVLLKREDDTSHFQCDLKITVTMNRTAYLATLFKSTPLDEPILFDPKLPPTNRLMTYTTNNLGGINLGELAGITIMKTESGVVS